MHLTVIIPTWKRIKKLEACLQSLELQTERPDLTIITVREEDQETHGFLNLWRSKSNLKYKIINVSRPGVIWAENAAIKSSLEEQISHIITFMDDDAIAFPDWIKKIKTFFENYPEAAALGGPDIILSEPWSYHDFPVKTVGHITFYGKVIGNHHRMSSGLREVDVLKGVNMSVQRKYLHHLDPKLQGDDPSQGNGVFWELDLCLKIKSQGGRIFFDPELLINHDSHHGHFIQEAVISSTAHNLGYVMMKYLPWHRSIIFLIYSVVIGNSHIRGLLKTFVMCLKEFSYRPCLYFGISLKGLIKGIFLYFFRLSK